VVHGAPRPAIFKVMPPANSRETKRLRPTVTDPQSGEDFCQTQQPKAHVVPSPSSVFRRGRLHGEALSSIEANLGGVLRLVGAAEQIRPRLVESPTIADEVADPGPPVNIVQSIAPAALSRERPVGPWSIIALPVVAAGKGRPRLGCVRWCGCRGGLGPVGWVAQRARSADWRGAVAKAQRASVLISR